MPKKATKSAAQSGIQSLQNECKAILQKLTVAHQDWVKNTEKAATKIKAQWVKADQTMKKAKAQQATIKSKGAGKKTASHKKQADKMATALIQAKAMVRSLKQEWSAVLPELKAAKAALKRHLAVEKVAAKRIVTVKVKGATSAKAKKTRSSKVKPVMVAEPV